MSAPLLGQAIPLHRTEGNRRIEKILRELGPEIRALLDDRTVIEIMLNADGLLWVERLGESLEALGAFPTTQAEALIYSLAAYHSTTITRDNPILECELPHYGARFEALIPPVVAAPVFTIRCRASQVFTLADYVSAGILNERQKGQLEAAVRERKNILVAGGTGSGKTTLANALIAEIVQA